MPNLTTTSVAASPVSIPAKTGNWYGDQTRLSRCHEARASMHFQPLSGHSKQCKLSTSCPVGLPLPLQPTDRRNSFLCAATLTQTLPNETQSKTISNAPDWNKLRKPDDGNKFPPGGGGGGGGGGGDGNFSGGWILFGILLFLDFLKDWEKKKEQIAH